MVIKAENHVEQKDVQVLINCNSSKVKFMLILLIITFVAFFIFCTIVGNKSGYLSYSILGVLWCAFVYGYIFLLNPKITYKAYKKKYTENALVKYQFTAKSVNITIDSKSSPCEMRKNYRDMFRIYETAEYYFFYVKRNESYIMKKSGISDGTVTELSEMIFKENPKNFIQKVK